MTAPANPNGIEDDTGGRLVAILRGVTPDRIEDVARALVEAGITTIEIPLNSPQPLESIERASRVVEQMCGARGLVGAGTVLGTDEVDKVHAAGGRLVVAPNMDARVIARALHLGMHAMPGVMTVTEALAAIETGAAALKIFPASLLGPEGLAAIRAVLPAKVRMFAVGGVGHGDFAAYAKAGVYGFGLGGSLYMPGDDAATVGDAARACVAAMRGLFARDARPSTRT